MKAFVAIFATLALLASTNAIAPSVTYQSQTFMLWTPADGPLAVGDQLIVQMQATMADGGGSCRDHVDILRATNQQLWCPSNNQQNFNGPYAFLQPVSGMPLSSNPNNNGRLITPDSVLQVTTAVGNVYQLNVPSSSTAVDFYSQFVSGGQTPFFTFDTADLAGFVNIRSAEAISEGQFATGYIAYDDGCRLKVDFDRSAPCNRFAVYRVAAVPPPPASGCGSASCQSHSVSCSASSTSFSSTSDCATLTFNC